VESVKSGKSSKHKDELVDAAEASRQALIAVMRERARNRHLIANPMLAATQRPGIMRT
jgi:hypothetical protein